MKIPALILRIGLAFSFFYAAIAGFISPESWVGWLPEFVRSESWLTLFGISEIIMGIWLLSGYRLFYCAASSSAMLFGIVVFNFGAIDVVFRDISLALSAVALAVLAREER